MPSVECPPPPPPTPDKYGHSLIVQAQCLDSVGQVAGTRGRDPGNARTPWGLEMAP